MSLLHRLFLRGKSPGIAGLAHEKSSVRAAAADELGDRHDRRALVALLNALKDRSPLVRKAAARAVGRLGFDRRVIAALADRLRDGHDDVREAAAGALASVSRRCALPRQALDAMLDGLKDRSPAVRALIAEALGRFGDRSATEALTTLLGDRREDVFQAAAAALDKLGEHTVTRRSATCDICDATVLGGDGYLLTTREVVREPRFWRHYYELHKAELHPLGCTAYDEFRRPSTARDAVLDAVGRQQTPWLVCASCIPMFNVDCGTTSRYAAQWWHSNGTFRPPGSGPAPSSAIYMSEAERSVMDGPLAGLRRAEEWAHLTMPQAQRPDTRHAIEESISKLREYGFRPEFVTDSEEKPYREALERVVELGEGTLPAVLEHLGDSELIALAVGRIGTDDAVNALGSELTAQDWRRVEAAARGLGLSGNPRAIQIIERARGSSMDRQVAEVNHALNWALGQLEKVRRADRWLEVDRERPWQQIQMIQQELPQLKGDEKRREQAIQWWREFTAVMPDMAIVVPGYDYTPEDAKSRAWSGLAVIIYYLLHPAQDAINSPCPEAKYCWEQALKLVPDDSFFVDCVRLVS